MAGLGLACEIVPAADDGPARSSDPAERVLAHARHKARAVAALRPGAFVLAGDTLVVLDGDFLPKPAGRAEAETMLRRLSGRRHEVWTATLVHAPDGREQASADAARVRFADLPEAELKRYLAGEEWRDKAGAYGIQGWAAAWTTLESGTLGTVVGFDGEIVRRILAAAGALR